MASFQFFDRDLSWLYFNERILTEAARETVPLLERFNFLSIYSSNLDEFYRVRIPALMALHRLYQKNAVSNNIAVKHTDVLEKAREIIASQLQQFGETLRNLIPALKAHNISLIYEQPIPVEIKDEVSHYFFSEVLGFIQVINIHQAVQFFPQNNQLYLAVIEQRASDTNTFVVNIPTNHLPRFFSVSNGDQEYICFLDDIVREHMENILPGRSIKGCYSFKVTRDAELNLDEVYGGNTANKIERQIAKRDYGFATRVLYQAGFPTDRLEDFSDKLELTYAMHMEGGTYHNLKDLSKLPVSKPSLKHEPWQPKQFTIPTGSSLFETLVLKDLLIHTPYNSYDLVWRFQ